MSSAVIYLMLALFVISAQGRIAVNEQLSEISSNTILQDKKPNPKEIHIDLSTEIPITTVKDETSNNVINETDDSDAADENSIKRDCKKESCDTDTTHSAKLNVTEYDPALILTKYIKEGKISEGRDAAKVDPDLFLGVESYSGYFNVDETYNSNIFFWYFPVEKKPVNETPWIIWLQGGPGASSMTGVFDEIGPFTVKTLDFELERNPYTWLKNHSLLFIENPVGTGFSFTDSEEGYATNMDTYGDHLYSALRQFLKVFPELKQAPLFVAGESYAGKYVASLAIRVHRNKQAPDGDINMQGLMVGNGYIDPGMIMDITRPFYYFGLLETEQIDSIRPLLESFQHNIRANNSEAAKNNWNHLIVILLQLTHQRQAYNFLRDELTVGRYIAALRFPKVMKALHVGNIRFSYVNITVNMKLNPDFLSSAIPLYEELLAHYRVLAYCGQLDLMLSCVCTSENYRTWKWSGSQEFLDAIRFPYIFNKRVAGYHKTGGNLTEAVVRGAGHMAPLDAPAPTQNLIARWVKNEPLSIGFGHLEGSYVQEYVRNNTRVNYLL